MVDIFEHEIKLLSVNIIFGLESSMVFQIRLSCYLRRLVGNRHGTAFNIGGIDLLIESRFLKTAGSSKRSAF